MRLLFYVYLIYIHSSFVLNYWLIKITELIPSKECSKYLISLLNDIKVNCVGSTLATSKEEITCFPGWTTLFLATPLPTPMATISYCSTFTYITEGIYILKTKDTYYYTFVPQRGRNIFTKAMFFKESGYLVSTNSWIKKKQFRNTAHILNMVIGMLQLLVKQHWCWMGDNKMSSSLGLNSCIYTVQKCYINDCCFDIFNFF